MRQNLVKYGMYQALTNIPWMSLNVFLALIPVALSYPLLKNPLSIRNVPIFLFWILFLPNSIYLLSDLEHLMNQISGESFLGVAVLSIQYAILVLFGILTYFLSLLPLEWFMRSKHVSLRVKVATYSAVSFLMAFGVVLGKIQRTHSWYVITNPMRVVTDVWNTLTSFELVLLTIVLGVLISIIILPFMVVLHPFKKSSFLPTA